MNIFGKLKTMLTTGKVKWSIDGVVLVAKVDRDNDNRASLEVRLDLPESFDEIFHFADLSKSTAVTINELRNALSVKKGK